MASDIGREPWVAFLNGEPIPGVGFVLNEHVRVLSEQDTGKKGYVLSLLEAGSDPLYMVELEDGSEAEVRQSELVPLG